MVILSQLISKSGVTSTLPTELPEAFVLILVSRPGFTLGAAIALPSKLPGGIDLLVTFLLTVIFTG